jgi:oligopeptide/dipeptide ABC transporter ATP-binding protein
VIRSDRRDLVLDVQDLRQVFPSRHGPLTAVAGVSFSIAAGEVVALVGESGSGKSTIANCVTRLQKPSSGTISFAGRDITRLSRRRMRPVRRDLHVVLQDPSASLNPRMSVGRLISEPLLTHRMATRATVGDRVMELMGQVGLPPEYAERYPHELSGGQQQRVSIARALSVEPSLLVADEPTSALDVSVQASILNLIRRLQREKGFACLFVTHNLAVAEFIADRIAVTYLGRIVEMADATQIFTDPRHPYTQALLDAAPLPDPQAQRSRRRAASRGEQPSPANPPPGCPYHTRCPAAVERCRTEPPRLQTKGAAGSGLVACHLVTDDGVAPDIIGRSGSTPQAQYGGS